MGKHDLSSKLYLAGGANVNYHKSVHDPTPTLPVGKQISKLSFQLSIEVHSVGQTEEERRAFSKGYKKEEVYCEITSKRNWLS